MKHLPSYFLGLLAISATALLAQDVKQIGLEVEERLGVRRDASPVHTLLKLPQAVPPTTGFRLLHHGKPIVAQFRPAEPGPRSRLWWLDFIAQSDPLETRSFVVRYGEDVKTGPERKSGHRLVKHDDSFVISHAPYIDWVVPNDLVGLLRSVNFRPSEYLKPDSPGLSIVDHKGQSYPLGGRGSQALVLREGLMTVGLRFQKQETDPGLSGVKWQVDLVFPGPLSWVDVQLILHDPQDRVRRAQLDLHLNLDPPSGGQRTLVELGASRTVYRSLAGTNQVELRAQADGPDPAWQVLRGHTDPLAPFVIARPQSDRAEGWAHVMDRQRCLAIAFQDFGTATADRIRVRADGTLQATRDFPTRGAKHWRCWLHFVQFPPQQSANTDPQMMQNPLVVRQAAL